MSRIKLTTLVFSGGGTPGVAYIGSLKYLEENNMIGEVTDIAGTSIGSIIAVMLGIGYTAVEMEEKLLGFNVEKLKAIDIDNFFTKYGIDSGKNVVFWLREMIGEKLGEKYKDITFSGLYELRGISLQIPATCVNRRRIEYFNKETHPNARVCDGVRASIGVPFMFTVVKCDSCFYNDGGLLDNFPIHLYKERIKMEEDVIKVLGFRINNDEDVSESVINGYEDYKLDMYVKDLAICVITEMTRLRNNKYSKRTVTINTTDKSCSLLDFNLSSEKIKGLIECGYEQTRDMISKLE